jgi:hypothetical protein
MVPTALEFFMKQKKYTNIEQFMIEFAKLHVDAALKKASDEAEVFKDLDIKNTTYGMIGVNSDSILNAYPLTNIK